MSLVDAVAAIKASGARMSHADVLAQLQQRLEFADVTISQVRRAITKAPKADPETKAKRRATQKREHDEKRVRTDRTRPAQQRAREAHAEEVAAREAAEQAAQEQERAHEEAERQRLRREAEQERQRVEAERGRRAQNLTSLRLLALRSLTSQMRGFDPSGANLMATRANREFAAVAARHRQESSESWPSYDFRQRQASLFEDLGLLAQAEQEWRLALECRPNGKPMDACLRCTVWHELRGVMRRRACQRYGLTSSGQNVWREGTVMAELAEQERAAETERVAPKTWEEIFVHSNACA